MQTPYELLPPVPSLTVTSTDVGDALQLPRPQWSGILGAGGDDRSPELTWRGHPAETASFTVTCFHPDAPTPSGFWRWAVVDLPVATTSLPGGAGEEDATAIPAPASQLRNDAGLARFLGAAPPPGHGRHRYCFAIHAVDAATLGVGPDVSNALLGFALFSQTLARATLVAWHER